jgi:hypothetical protein
MSQRCERDAELIGGEVCVELVGNAERIRPRLCHAAANCCSLDGRIFTMANSDATKKAFARTSATLARSATEYRMTGSWLHLRAGRPWRFAEHQLGLRHQPAEKLPEAEKKLPSPQELLRED